MAEILGYSNTKIALADHFDDENKGVTKRDTLGGCQEMTIINDSGLYSLILSREKVQTWGSNLRPHLKMAVNCADIRTQGRKTDHRERIITIKADIILNDAGSS